MKKFFSQYKFGMSRDSRIPEDHGKHFSASGSSRKLEIWIFFSDRDPNPRPSDGNCFEVELLIKLHPL